MTDLTPRSDRLFTGNDGLVAFVSDWDISESASEEPKPKHEHEISERHEATTPTGRASMSSGV